MATLTVANVTRAGVAYSLTAAAGAGDKFLPSKDTFFAVANGGGSPITVTFVSTNTSYGLAVADAGGSVTNGTTSIFGPFPAEVFANASDGLCDVTYSTATSVTVNPFRMQQP